MALTPEIPKAFRGTAAPARKRKPKVTPKATTKPVAGTSTKSTDALRDRAARDPNYRSKLPDSALTPSQLRARKLNARLAAYDKDPLYNPGEQLSGRRLVTAARALADLETKPAVDALERQGRSATVQGTALIGRAGDYYRQLGDQGAASQLRQAALAQNLNTDTGQIAQTTRDQLAAIAGQEQSRAAADAEVRGSLGADDRVGQQIGHDRAIAEAVLANAGTRAASQGTAYQELTNLASMARGMRGGEIQGQLSNRLANQQSDVRQKIADEESLRGPRMTKSLLDLRQQGFENATTQAGLGIDQAKIDATLAGIKQRSAASVRTAATTRRGQDIASEDRRRGQSIDDARLIETERHNKTVEQIQKDKRARGGKESAGAIRLRQGIDGMTGEAQRLKSMTGYKRLNGRVAKRRYIANVLRNRAKRAGQTLPDYLLSPVIDLVEDGHVGKDNARVLESYGVTIPAAWRRKTR